MARALMGHVGTSNEHVLAFEVTRLRRRVAELESELAEVRAQRTAELDLRDLELHHLAGSAEPVLA
jgi:Viral A-type inclusion protein repeat